MVSTSSDEEDEFVAINLQVEATAENVEQYRYKLEADGFTGDWQIQRKYIDGHEHVVDFTFSLDNNEIRIMVL